MIATTLHTTAPDRARFEGAVVCQNVPDPSGGFRLRKGQRLSAADLERLAELGDCELHVLLLGPDDVHEDEAGRRLAEAVAGEGVALRGIAQSQARLVATRRGLLAVRREALDAVNDIEGMAVFTLYDGQVVDENEQVAAAKVTPLAVPAADLARAEALARQAGGLVAVRAFQPRKVGVLVKETLDDRARERFHQALRRKLAWLGGELVAVEPAANDPTDCAAGLGRLLSQVDIVLAAGGNAVDPLDPLFAALPRVGAVLEKHGAPAHPGSMFWVAYREDTPILGLASCELLSQATILDLALPRLFVGDRLSRAAMASFGYGGLLNRKMAWRFPEYEGDARERP